MGRVGRFTVRYNLELIMKKTLLKKAMMLNGERVISHLYEDHSVRVFSPGDYTEGTHKLGKNTLLKIKDKLLKSL